MAKVQAVQAREILDSRGNPTVETVVVLDDGAWGVAAVPSGASVGKNEAVELRDNDQGRMGGMGVLKAVDNVNKVIAPALLGKLAENQAEIDDFLIKMDGTPNKSKLGANAILSVSLALCTASAQSARLPLYKYINKLAFNINLPISVEKMPTPIFNLINGGKHGGDNLDFQEFHVIPATSTPYRDALKLGVEVYQRLKITLKERGSVFGIGDEGGLTPNLLTNADALAMLLEAIQQTPYHPSYDVFLGLDVAASNLKKMRGYQIKDRSQTLSTDEMIAFYQELQKNFHLLILEDPLNEDDWDDWEKLTKTLGEQLIIVGDDLLTTNLERLKKAVQKKAVNAILIKPNQIGTLTETLAVIKLAKESAFKTVVSHRSGETTDTFIADLAVAIAADYVKFGAPARGERVAKYNRLSQIENELFPA
ncbi:phosphopyruvate hydratase [Candidatus Microgenomates bacterium]|nr:phosphopyruvate hydratase [Candidatus Microgenomates bacterium]